MLRQLAFAGHALSHVGFAGATGAETIGKVIIEVDRVLAQLQPEALLLLGDTNSCLSVIPAKRRKIPVFHMEAGNRCFDQRVPEEINRRLASVVTDLHFAPTGWARQNLLHENIPEEHIIVTGNPVIDALQAVMHKPATPAVLELFARIGVPYRSAVSPHRDSPGSQRLILVTAHRRENFGQPLEHICQAIKEIAHLYQAAVRIVYPVHLNPNVQEPVHRILENLPNISLLEPLDYLPMVHLMRHASLVLTDSGGLQEEAPALGIPVLVMRLVTERPEGVQAGTVRLVGTHTNEIVSQVRLLLDDSRVYAAMAQAINPYGDGKAAARIVDAILAANNITIS